VTSTGSVGPNSVDTSAVFTGVKSPSVVAVKVFLLSEINAAEVTTPTIFFNLL
jgi:hypothetical protein